MADDMVAITKRELERWPGASVTFSNGGKHGIATIGYQGRTRMVVFACTPSGGTRSDKNHIATVRRELLALGAARVATPKRTAPKRQRNKPQRSILADGKAPVIANGFDKLAAVKIIPEPRLSFVQRVKAALGRLFA